MRRRRSRPLDPFNDEDGDGQCGDVDVCPRDFENDSDADGVCGDVDNCRYEPNGSAQAGLPGVGDQLDRGGVGRGSAPDRIGDACQCGDVTGDGRVTTADIIVAQRSLLTPPTATPAHPERCDVGGTLGCTLADVSILRDALLMPPRASIVHQCAPALP